MRPSLIITVLSRFPRIPPEAINLIARHATMKRMSRVGRTGTIEMGEKAFLATQAHVRHTKTDYDALLRSGICRGDARKSTSQLTLNILKEWGPAHARRQERLTTARTKKSAKESINSIDSLLKVVHSKAAAKITKRTARRQKPLTTRTTRSIQGLTNRMNSLLKEVHPKAPNKITQHTAPANGANRASPIPDTSQQTEQTAILSLETPGGETLTSLPANSPASVVETRRVMMKRQCRAELDQRHRENERRRREKEQRRREKEQQHPEEYQRRREKKQQSHERRLAIRRSKMRARAVRKKSWC